MKELIYASATAQAQEIRTGGVSSRELVEMHLKRIEAVNPKLNAVVQLAAEDALRAARRADEDLAKGMLRGPLHGVPITIKDSIEAAGMTCTSGTLGRSNFVSASDATAVSRLRGAGAIPLGKTNLPDLLFAFESDNLIYGRTNNPYDLSRTAGGSSGGEAAAIAAGESPLGVGSDAAGSIRLPSHFCGIAGIKPTSGRLARTGHFPPPGGLFDALWQIGPMARFVEDLILVMPVLSGVDWLDPAVVPMPWRDPDAVDLRSLRAAFYTNNGILPAAPESAAAVKEAAASLAYLGARIEEARPAGIEQTYELALGLFGADAGAGLRELLQACGSRKAHPLLERFLSMLGARPLAAPELGRLLIRVDTFRSAMLSFLEKYDLVLCPVCADAAMPHGTTFDHLEAFTYTMSFNLTGWPAVVVRCGTSTCGLPLGVQIAARPWREDVALAVARQLEADLGGWQRPPL